ncbi:hypothetical protein ACJX0J_023359, partial [Zea mays]
MKMDDVIIELRGMGAWICIIEGPVRSLSFTTLKNKEAKLEMHPGKLFLRSHGSISKHISNGLLENDGMAYRIPFTTKHIK